VPEYFTQASIENASVLSKSNELLFPIATWSSTPSKFKPVAGWQATGAVNNAFCVSAHPASSENDAVTSTAKPSAVRLVNVTVCGEPVMAKLCPLTSNVPVEGALA
jgi:hypothetical protein